MVQEKKTGIKRDILLRVRMLYLFFVLAGVAIFARVLWIQYGPQGDELRRKARRITYERVTIEADRGDILARDGRTLAISIPTFEIRMDFAAAGLADSVFNRDVDSLAYCLATFFKDKSVAAYRNKLVTARRNRKSNRYVRLSPRRVNYIELKQITRFPIFRLGQNRGGLIVEQVNLRLRPHGSLAARTIGRVNQTGTKIGIEGAFDHDLKGIDGNTLMQRVSGSFKVPVPDAENVEPVNGIDVVTTLDVDIQDVAETALKRQLDLGHAQWGTVVLMEVATGEIRAMANLTRKGEGQFVEDFNYAIGMNLEPGSTFKLASLIALLDDAKMTLDDKIDTEGGTARVGKAKIVDSHKDGVLTLRQVFEHSSNVGFAKAVWEHYQNDPARFVDFICGMGLAKELGMQIAGEATPVVKHPGERYWDGTTLAMMAYGYALRLTPMHTLALYNAVANDGRMVRPLLVRELREYGQTVRTFPTETLVPKICSSETLDKVRGCLEGVVNEGTARVLKSPYYTVAGKTGTAQIAQGRHGYTDARGGRHYLATLVGYFPADKPKYSCIVAIKTYYGSGSYHTYYGASLSGPVFRAIADRVVASQVEWQEPISKRYDGKWEGPVSLKGGPAPQVRRVSSKLSLPVEGERRGRGWVQTRTDSTFVEVIPLEQQAGRVPDVRGMGLKDAVYLLEKSGLKVSFRGRGRVVSQSVPPGAEVHRGEVVGIVLEV